MVQSNAVWVEKVPSDLKIFQQQLQECGTVREVFVVVDLDRVLIIYDDKECALRALSKMATGEWGQVIKVCI